MMFLLTAIATGAGVGSTLGGAIATIAGVSVEVGMAYGTIAGAGVGLTAGVAELASETSACCN